MKQPTWFRVAGTSVNGAAKRTPEEAWDSFRKAAELAGHPENLQNSINVADARLVAGTSRRAVQRADVSVTWEFSASQGSWWTAGEDPYAPKF